MTISQQERDAFQSRVSDFHSQPEPDDCLPTAIKNILHDLAVRKDEPALNVSISNLNEALDYNEGRAARSDRIASRVDPLIEGGGYEIMKASASPEQLQKIANSSDTSLPVCELDSEYFEYVDHGYNPEQGRDRYGRFQHVVIPMSFNDDTILYYDPYLHFFPNSDEDMEMELPYDIFYELWNRPEKRWTLWARPKVQQTLQESMVTDDGDN